MATATATSAQAAPDPPGPHGHRVLGNTLSFKNDIVSTLMRGHRDYGDVVKFRGVGPLFPIYSVAHPDHAMHVLKDNAANYPRTPIVRKSWRMLVGEGLICIEGEHWRDQRKLAQPSFDPKLLQQFDELVVDETDAMLESWERLVEHGAPFDAHREMTKLAIANVGGAMFSADWRDIAEEMAEAIDYGIGHAYKAATQPMPPESVPIPPNRKFKHARRTLEEIMEGVIARRRGLAEQPDDLLGALLNARDANGNSLSQYQLRSHLMTFMFGGHETVAVGLAWTWWLLSTHPEAMRRIEVEVDGALGDARPTFENTKDLDYLTRVVSESLRIRPPVWLMSRMNDVDDEIGGYRIPAGSQVLVSSFVSHHHPGFWDNPEGFDPDRFLPERSEGRPRHAWFPFSGGPHQCIGGYFGLMEMKLVIARVLQRCELDVVPGHRVDYKPGFTLGFKHGLQMTARRRPASSRETDAGAQKAAEPAGAST
jgi:cytochrome P450